MKSTNLKLCLLQSDLHWEDVDANLAIFSERISALSTPVHLIVLPEVFNTGFCAEAARFAEPMEGPTMQWMASQAMDSGAVVTGSLTIAEHGTIYNRMIWMRPDGSYAHYDKRHLFSLGHEQEEYQPGASQQTVELQGWKINLQICYDLRFPAWCRSEAPFDLQLFIANWPKQRATAWNTLLKARAIENQCYVAGVNRVGTDGRGAYHSGDSTIIDPMGVPLVQASDTEETIITTLDHSSLASVRRELPFLKDRDRFSII